MTVNMQTEGEGQTLSFIAEWFDPHPQLTKKYLLKYYTNTHEVEMKEVCSGRKFLKRTKIDHSTIAPENLYLGATVILFSRDLKLVDYGDNITRVASEVALEKAIIVLMPKISGELGRIIQILEDENLTLSDLTAFHLQKDFKEEMESLLGLDKISKLTQMESQDSQALNYVIEFRGKNALEISNSMLTEFGGNVIMPSSAEETETFHKLISHKRQKSTATYDPKNTTCCVVKPHVIKTRSAGAVLNDILSRGYHINAIGFFHLPRTCAEEFYEIYNCAIKEYNSMVDELSSGPIIGIEVRGNVLDFRQSAGPWHVEMAKNLFPETIRAKFGKDIIQNAIHCTDLPEDNTSETSYLFHTIISQRQC